MGSTKVGIREFRARLGRYLVGTEPIAITSHGRTVGFYIPARRDPETEDREALREAGCRLQEWMAALPLNRGAGTVESGVTAAEEGWPGP